MKSTLQGLFQTTKALAAQQDQLSLGRSTKPPIEGGSDANFDPSRLTKAISTMFVTLVKHCSLVTNKLVDFASLEHF
jgi:hypothetical protein